MSRLVGAFVCVSVVAVGCVSMPQMAPATPPLLAEGTVYDDAQWALSREHARTALAPHLASGGYSVVDDAGLQLTGRGSIIQPTTLTTAGCYVLALGWASVEPVRAQVLFSGDSGVRVSDTTGGTISSDFTGGHGVLPFCIDRPGEVTLSVLPLDAATGALLSRWQAQYVGVLAMRPETAEARAARHAEEATGVANSTAREAANIAAVQQREDDRQRDCVVERDKCVSGFKHRRPLSARPTDTCERVLQRCLADEP